MDKSIRCTVCTWRGTWSEAAEAPRPIPAEVSDDEAIIQEARVLRQSDRIRVGATPEPACPVCGHTTQLVKRHSIRPAV